MKLSLSASLVLLVLSLNANARSDGFDGEFLSCKVQFATISEGENPWYRLKYVREFEAKMVEAEGDVSKLNNIEVISELREWLMVGPSVISENPHGFKSGSHFFRSYLNSGFGTFNTVRMSDGKPLARYTSSIAEDANTTNRLISLEVCKPK